MPGIPVGHISALRFRPVVESARDIQLFLRVGLRAEHLGKPVVILGDDNRDCWMFDFHGKSDRLQDFRHAIIARVARHDAPDPRTAQEVSLTLFDSRHQSGRECRAVCNGDFRQLFQHPRAEVRHDQTAIRQQLITSSGKHRQAVGDRIDVDGPPVFLVQGRQLSVRHHRNDRLFKATGEAVSGVVSAIAVTVYDAQVLSGLGHAVQDRRKVPATKRIPDHPATGEDRTGDFLLFEAADRVVVVGIDAELEDADPFVPAVLFIPRHHLRRRSKNRFARFREFEEYRVIRGVFL